MAYWWIETVESIAELSCGMDLNSCRQFSHVCIYSIWVVYAWRGWFYRSGTNAHSVRCRSYIYGNLMFARLLGSKSLCVFMCSYVCVCVCWSYVKMKMVRLRISYEYEYRHAFGDADDDDDDNGNEGEIEIHALKMPLSVYTKWKWRSNPHGNRIKCVQIENRGHVLSRFCLEMSVNATRIRNATNTNNCQQTSQNQSHECNVKTCDPKMMPKIFWFLSFGIEQTA